MEGDFSKIPRSKKQEQEDNYSRVLFQQGRVLTDADWNEQAAIQDSHDTRSLRDIIGKNGIPLEEKESFKITPTGEGNRFTIGKGRIYVDGKLVENFKEVGNYSFSDGTTKVLGQPYLPSLTIKGHPTSDAIPTEPGTYLAYLQVFNRHMTYLEDSDIQESALGGADTSTRLQTVWQVRLHKLEDDEGAIKNPNEENKWAPWISLKNDREDEVVGDVRIGSNNDGSLLEVFALSNRVTRKSRRQESLDPVKWEEKWDRSSLDVDGYSEFDIASRHVDDLEILHTFGIRASNHGLQYRIRNTKDDRWDKEDAPPKGGGPNGLIASQPKLILNPENNLEVFVIGVGTSNDDFKIYHSKKQENSTEWEDWRPVGHVEDNKQFTKFSVILNPNNNCIEIYAIARKDHLVWYTVQDKPDSTRWKKWTKINPDSEPPVFEEIVAGLNGKNQVVIFAKDARGKQVWSTLRKEPDSAGNGWSRVGTNKPGRLTFGSGCLSVQNNRKKQNSLELFGIFSDQESPAHGFGSIWNIGEDEDGMWKSNWKIINENQKLEASKVASATDKKSRVNIFAIEGGTGIVYHSYLEDKQELVSCQLDIPSWESKIKPSTWQMKARAKPQAPRPDDPCLLPEQAGYRRLENQLYRIEVHKPILEGKNATFKYSRDNGAVCSRIIDISGEKITVGSIGRDRLLGFNVGQWIEIDDDLRNLWGKPGVLVRIKDVDGMNLIFDSDTIIPPTAKIDNNSFPQEFNPTARRWDSSGALDVGIPASNNGWIKIEDGIEVKFKNIDKTIDICRTADYCTIPARTLKADIEWPKGPDGLPEFVDIEGIEYHYAKLAFLEYTDDGNLELISDCRDFFPPLNTLEGLTHPQIPESRNIICWTHGTISRVGFPERLDRLGGENKEGTGTTYTQGFNNSPGTNFNWFHFPLTVSYPLEPDKKISLQNIHIRYRMDTVGPEISDIFIYDGTKIIAKLTDLSLSGDHITDDDKFNTFTLEPGIEVKQSIGISVRVSFIEGPNASGMITFNGVGVQLKID